MRHRSIAKRRMLLNHRLDRLKESAIDLRCGLDRSVVHRPPRHPEPPAQLAHRDLDAFGFESLTDRLDHFSSSPSRDCNFFRARNSSIASPYAYCSSLSRRSYSSRTSNGLARSAFSMPRLPSSTHSSIPAGGTSNDRLASATVVLP